MGRARKATMGADVPEVSPLPFRATLSENQLFPSTVKKGNLPENQGSPEI